ncbi:MAG: hypothetical protein RBT74_13205 [Tenuifilaceae bacterium]|jgi:hypothetical protein|nr:hypothetical protein [Tenuifilaceae bacterium]
MINRLFKKNSDSEVINYSTKGVCFNPAINLQKHYTEYFEAYHDEAVFFEELFEYLDPKYEELNSEKWSLPENLLAQFINNEKVITTFKSIEDYRLSEFHNRLVSTFKEINNKKIRNLISNSALNVTSDDLREGIKTQFSECFNNTILNISRHLDIVLNHDIFSVGNCKRILLDLMDETIKPERYSSNSFSVNNGSTGNFLDPVYKIAIKHTTFALDNLSVDDKIALIPTLEKHLHNEQNYKIAKGHKYKGIDGLEDFYQLYFNRFKDLKTVRAEKVEQPLCFKLNIRGSKTKDQIEKETKKKEEEFKNVFKGLSAHYFNNFRTNDFESLFNTNAKAILKYNFKGNLYELMLVISFLKKKEIITQYNLWNTIKDRFLINDRAITEENTLLIEEFRKVELDKNSEIYKLMNKYL